MIAAEPYKHGQIYKGLKDLKKKTNKLAYHTIVHSVVFKPMKIKLLGKTNYD